MTPKAAKKLGKDKNIENRTFIRENPNSILFNNLIGKFLRANVGHHEENFARKK